MASVGGRMGLARQAASPAGGGRAIAQEKCLYSMVSDLASREIW